MSTGQKRSPVPTVGSTNLYTPTFMLSDSQISLTLVELEFDNYMCIRMRQVLRAGGHIGRSSLAFVISSFAFFWQIVAGGILQIFLIFSCIYLHLRVLS